MTDPIDFKAKKEQRNAAAAEQVRWEALVDELRITFLTSDMQFGGIVSATLRALIDMLVAEHAGIKGMTVETAKRFIGEHLNAFYDKPNRGED